MAGSGGVRVDLDPDRPALARLGVDHDHRGVGLLVLADVVDGRGLARAHVGRGVDAGDLHEDHRPGAEAVRGVVGRGFDVDPVACSAGIISSLKCTRRPVWLVGSATV